MTEDYLVSARIRADALQLTPPSPASKLFAEIQARCPIDKLYAVIPTETGFAYREIGDVVITFIPKGSTLDVPPLPEIRLVPAPRTETDLPAPKKRRPRVRAQPKEDLSIEAKSDAQPNRLTSGSQVPEVGEITKCTNPDDPSLRVWGHN